MRAQLSPAGIYWRVLAVALMLAGTAGGANWGAEGRGGAGVVSHGGEDGVKGSVVLRPQVVRRTLRVGEGETGETGKGGEGEEQRGSADCMEELHITAAAAGSSHTVLCGSAAAAAAGAADAAADAAAADAAADAADIRREEAAGSSSTGSSSASAVVHRVLASSSAGVAAASLPQALPSPSVGRPSQQANDLPPECRDDRVREAVTISSFRHPYSFPRTSSFVSLHPYEITLNNTCQQRAISLLSISVSRVRLRSYILLPRLTFSTRDNFQAITVFTILPPLGAPENAAIIPAGGSIKFNTTVVLDLFYSAEVYEAAFSPL
ncbi:hypothetical protein CLOM_g9732 [Closterium sp. NIES-68]|nr:hypothetical protein CLOM_g9732 [Closterium sp. NIES-68]GJP86405.1 hypothetical protein CLOP_g16429 [Closterium sp. NIES-67]